MQAFCWSAQTLQLVCARAAPNDAQALCTLVRVARFVPDTVEFFPQGQHDTIADLERKLDSWASEYAQWRWGDRERYGDRDRREG